MNDRLLCYQESPVRKNWEHPSLDEIAHSLKKAHAVNRSLVNEVNALYDEKKKTKAELAQVQSDLGKSQLKAQILTSLLSSAVTSAIFAVIMKVLK